MKKNLQQNHTKKQCGRTLGFYPLLFFYASKYIEQLPAFFTPEDYFWKVRPTHITEWLNSAFINKTREDVSLIILSIAVQVFISIHFLYVF